MEPYSQTPLNLALRSERKAEEFIRTWRFNHAAQYYQKAADNISKALEEERANRLVPNSILESLEEQKKFYLYQEKICHNRRSHVGHLFKDKGQLSYNLSKQAEQFAQAHSLLIRSQNYLHQQQQLNQQQQQTKSLDHSLHPNKQANRIEHPRGDSPKSGENTKFYQVDSTEETAKLIAEAILHNPETTIKKINAHTTVDNRKITNKEPNDKLRENSSSYNITSNPLCDHTDIKPNLTATTSNALVLRPPESSFAVMAAPSRSNATSNDLFYSVRGRQKGNPMQPFQEEEDPEDYDLGDKFNQCRTSSSAGNYRNLLYEINRLFSEHNTLLDYLSTNSIQPISRQSTTAAAASTHRVKSEFLHSQPSNMISERRNLDDKHISCLNEILPKYSNDNERKEKETINDHKFSDTLNKLRWNQSKLRNIISDLVQQLERTNEDNERLKCQILTRNSTDSRSDILCHLPPLEPPTLQY